MSTGDTHTHMHTHLKTHMEKDPPWEKSTKKEGGRFHTSFGEINNTVRASNAAAAGHSASDVTCTSGSVYLTPENLKLFEETAFLVLNSCNKPKKTSNYDVILKVSLSAPWWQAALNTFTYQLNVKVMMPDLFRGALEDSEFQDSSPSALVPHCMQLVPFVVLFSLAPQTSQNHHCAGVQPICASAHLCISRCLLVFVLFFIPQQKKPWLQHRNETGLVITKREE